MRYFEARLLYMTRSANAATEYKLVCVIIMNNFTIVIEKICAYNALLEWV